MGFSGKKLLLLGFVVVLMVVIPLTVYLVQQQQKLSVGAQAASTLSFTLSQGSSATINKPTDTASFDVMLDPSTNQVSFVKLVISYEAAKVKVETFTPNTVDFPTVLQQPDKGNGKASVTVSVGDNPNKIVTGSPARKVATISFSALSTATAGTTQIQFDKDPSSGTQVLSLGTGDQFNENVWTGISSPATITIAQAAVGGANQVPVCSSSTVDKATTGTAPYAINLQAKGTDSDGTIAKINFDWGDTQKQELTTGFGIGTNSVDITQNHTYQNAGTFNAVVTFTDDKGGVSIAGNCAKTFTITAASTGGAGTGTSTGSTGTGSTGTGSTGSTTGGTGTTQIVTVATPEPTPVPTVAPEVTPSEGTKGGLPAPGPEENILAFGGLGAFAIIIGVLLLFGL